jgi:hypothetical protein
MNLRPAKHVFRGAAARPANERQRNAHPQKRESERFPAASDRFIISGALRPAPFCAASDRFIISAASGPAPFCAASDRFIISAASGPAPFSLRTGPVPCFRRNGTGSRFRRAAAASPFPAQPARFRRAA